MNAAEAMARLAPIVRGKEDLNRDIERLVKIMENVIGTLKVTPQLKGRIDALEGAAKSIRAQTQ